MTQRITSAAQRVMITTTTLHNDCDEIEALIQACEHAAQRGVHVSILADSLTYTEIKGSLLNLKKQQQRGIEAVKLARRLKNTGVDFRWLGHDASVGFIGRTHAKWSIVDDTVYAFGGMNLDKGSLENTDFMFKINSVRLADWLADCHQLLISHDKSGTGMRNRSVTDTDGSWHIIVDGGMPGNSAIYKRAVVLAKKSKEITAVSQYCPTGKLMRAIKRCPAHYIYFNRIKNATWLNRMILGLGMHNHRHNLYTRQNYLHAKYLIFTMKNGKKIALTGSHNFVGATGMIGTREIALETTDPHLITALESFTKDTVA